MSRQGPFPREIFGIILEHVDDVKTLYHCDLTCVMFHQIIRERELYDRRGFVYVPPPPPPRMQMEDGGGEYHAMGVDDWIEYSEPDDSMEGGICRCFCIECDCCYSFMCPCVCLFNVFCFPCRAVTGCVRCRTEGSCICPCVDEAAYRRENNGHNICCCCIRR